MGLARPNIRRSTPRRLGGLAGVDGIGEVPGGQRPRLAQERLEVARPRRWRPPRRPRPGCRAAPPAGPCPPPGARRGGPSPDRPRRTGPSFRWSASHWDRARPVPTEVSTTSPDGAHGLGEGLGHGRHRRPPAPGSSWPAGPQVGDQALGVRRAASWPTSRTTTTRRSTRNGGVVQASITAPTSNGSAPGPPNSSTTRDGSPPADQALGQGMGGLGHQGRVARP